MAKRPVARVLFVAASLIATTAGVIAVGQAQDQVVVRIPGPALLGPTPFSLSSITAAAPVRAPAPPVAQPARGEPATFQGKIPAAPLQTSLLVPTPAGGIASDGTPSDVITGGGTDQPREPQSASTDQTSSAAIAPSPTGLPTRLSPATAPPLPALPQAPRAETPREVRLMMPAAAKPALPASIVLGTGTASSTASTAAAAQPAGDESGATPATAPAQLRVRQAPVAKAAGSRVVVSQRPPGAAPPPGAATGQGEGAEQPAGAIPIGAGSSGTLVLELDRGELIHLPRPAATVFVANPAVADVQVKSSTLIYVFAKKSGETTLIAVDGDDKLLLDKRVMVNFNQTRLREMIKQIAPDRQVELSTIGDQIVLSGVIGSPAESEDIRRMAAAVVGDEKKVINRMKIAAPIQVNLRVRVAEMSKDITKQFGFNWNLVKNILPGESGPGVLFSLVNPNSNSINNFLQFTAHSGPYDINTVIDAMEDTRLIKLLAEPNLTALSGQTANFLVGGEFPVPVPQDRDTITIEFKKFGVQLAFEPIVLSGNLIDLHVRPEVSELTDQGALSIAGFTIPALNTRRAETTIELASGQSFAIAGLLRSDVTHSVSKWPGLADIPILGTLFRSDQFQRNETELVIIVTPYIVDPVKSPDKLALPTDGFRPPHDLDRIFYGAMWRKQELPGGTNPPQRPRLSGPAGFAIE